ncbi:MAG: hypothetical protein R2717_00595 [Schumannella sp.]
MRGFIDHDMDLVMKACQRVTVLDVGRVPTARRIAIRDDPQVVEAYLGVGS